MLGHPSSRLNVIRGHLLSSSVDSMPRLKLSVSESVSLMDERIHIKVSGLSPNQLVTIKLTSLCPNSGRRSVSQAVYMTDRQGDLDLDSSSALTGSYSGVDGMGLFWSLQRIGKDGSSSGSSPDISKQFIMDLQLYSGDQRVTTEDIPPAIPMVEKQLVRLNYLHTRVRRVPVEGERFHGTIFIPNGEGPFPGVIDMYGAYVKLKESRAALLASRGYVTYALTYLHTGNLPKSPQEFDLSYILDAVHWFRQRPYVNHDRVGVVGTCHGGFIALYIAAMIPQVKVAVNVCGLTFFDGHSLGIYRTSSSRDPTCKPLPWPDPSKIRYTEKQIILKDMFNCVDPFYIPAWQHGCHVLLISGGDDQQMDYSCHSSFKEACPTESRTNIRLLHYPGAGHLIDPPYRPLVSAISLDKDKMEEFKYIKPEHHDKELLFGGSHRQHAIAQEDSWREILRALKEQLC